MNETIPNSMMLCLAMRQDNDFTALPILADALEDEGRDEEAALCRQPHTLHQAQRTVCLVMGGIYADAVVWLEELAYEHDIGYCRDGLLIFSPEWAHESERPWKIEPSEDKSRCYFALMEQLGDGWSYDDTEYHITFTGGSGDYFRDSMGSEERKEFLAKVALVQGKDELPWHIKNARFGCSC